MAAYAKLLLYASKMHVFCIFHDDMMMRHGFARQFINRILKIV